MSILVGMVLVYCVNIDLTATHSANWTLHVYSGNAVEIVSNVSLK